MTCTKFVTYDVKLAAVIIDDILLVCVTGSHDNLRCSRRLLTLLMEGEDDYVGQLKDVFDDCDSHGQGQITREDLIVLCEKLRVEDQADALVERLIGTSENKRVGFEEFKDGFVAVLSQCADLISTEDEVSASANSYNDDEGN